MCPSGITTDERGRITIPKAVRERFGERYRLVELEDDIKLMPVPDDPLESHRGDLEVSLATFIELFLVEERFAFDREEATLAILELAETDVDPDAVFQASAYIDDGLNTFDAFHAALANDAILSSDQAFETIELDRVALGPDTENYSSR
ncbi:AbrB/MazE/SpoVT family DNA-binding domain-containing protein [Natrinema longum]|uniref:AbrB/MazE/SpoVT family DNA-binding domain-containing protein n=1 Tax=Natrinema longum TaxID=370324 RepID=UPI001CCA35A5|nr:AbrB/MazE/SpoVT family DNA-binding domain-containing protein [Natrinema longum]